MLMSAELKGCVYVILNRVDSVLYARDKVSGWSSGISGGVFGKNIKKKPLKLNGS